MNEYWKWSAGFLLMYVLHAASVLMHRGYLLTDVPAELAPWSVALTAAGLILLVVTHVATRDEVIRARALKAAAASAVAVGMLSYLNGALSLTEGMLAGTLWALALAVYLVVYGALAWRSRY